MTRNASQPGKNFPRKIKVGLAEHTLFRVIGMTVRNTEVVFKNEPEGSPGRLGYMHEYDHDITADRKSLLRMGLVGRTPNWSEAPFPQL
jgi:hypothetical protein